MGCSSTSQAQRIANSFFRGNLFRLAPKSTNPAEQASDLKLPPSGRISQVFFLQHPITLGIIIRSELHWISSQYLPQDRFSAPSSGEPSPLRPNKRTYLESVGCMTGHQHWPSHKVGAVNMNSAGSALHRTNQLGEQGTQGIMNGVAITVTICRLQQPSIRKGTFLKADGVSEVVVPRAEVVSIELTASE